MKIIYFVQLSFKKNYQQQACIKSAVWVPAWHEQLGHVRLIRTTAAEREERKKLDKREKKERDEEEERYRTAYNFVKYSLGLRHQVKLISFLKYWLSIFLCIFSICIICIRFGNKKVKNTEYTDSGAGCGILVQENSKSVILILSWVYVMVQLKLQSG